MKTAVFVMIFLAFLLPQVHAFQVKAEPSSLLPGDAFLVMLTGVKKDIMPEASFRGTRLSFSSCGKECFFAFAAADIKTVPGRYKVRVKTGSGHKVISVMVKPHEFPVIKLTLPQEKVTLSQEDEARAEREAMLMKSLWQQDSARLWEAGFILPVNSEISTQYGVKRIINEKKESIHGGIDMRGKTGDEVSAANSGSVVYADELFFGGNTVVLDHGMGVHTVYMHLSGFNRGVGDKVLKGDVIGFVGSTGRSTGPHLHFGVKIGEASVNPVSFIKLNL